MTGSGKRARALGKDQLGRPVMLMEDGEALTLRRLAVGSRDTEARIELTPEIVAALKHALASR